MTTEKDSRAGLAEGCFRLRQGKAISRPNDRFNNGDTLLHALIKQKTTDPELVSEHHKLTVHAPPLLVSFCAFVKKPTSELLISRLLKQGADPNAVDWNRETPLMLACGRQNSFAAVVALVNDPRTVFELQDGYGNSALLTAVRWRRALTVKTLLKAARQRGQSALLLQQRDIDGRHPAQIATLVGDAEIVNQLATERAHLAVALQKATVQMKKTSHTHSSNAPPSKDGGGGAQQSTGVPPVTVQSGGWVSYRRQLRRHPSMDATKDAGGKDDAADDKQTPRERLEKSVVQLRSVHMAKSRFLTLIGAYHSSDKEAGLKRKESMKPTTAAKTSKPKGK